MSSALRASTLQTLGLGSVLDLVKGGGLPADRGELVERVFGPASRRGALVISGANGIVGAGKTAQLGSRLEPYGVPLVALDFPGVPDGIGRQYPGLVRAFGRERAAAIAANVVKLSYDGASLPPQLAALGPRVLVEAIPEVLDLKRTHYQVFRAAFPGIEIRSVTSGFPQSQLGVGIAHPAFPHEINKVFEVVEPSPSAVTHLLWALGLVPVPVSDNWSFVLDVLFCGLTQAAIRATEDTNLPPWKADKYIRQMLGPNPFRAHDAIGAAGANFLTWSCLHHLGREYGPLFTPATSLRERKESGEDWYPPNHFRPLVNWTLEADGQDELRIRTVGPLYQMLSIMVHEERSHLAQMNIIGELCAQFRHGLLAVARRDGADAVIAAVEAYHRLHPEAAQSPWYPDVFAGIARPEWQQLYVNAEHDGQVGVVSIGRESYSWEVDAELDRALDWLLAEGIERVVVTHDFHLASQLVGADTGEFYPALSDAERGAELSRAWSKTARRLASDFAASVGLIAGKRCLGGMLELMLHCHFVVADADAEVGMPEVTLPVLPGMEFCHWPFRRTDGPGRAKLLRLLLEGRPMAARDAVGWLVDFAGPLDQALRTAWQTASGGEGGLQGRPLLEDALEGVTATVPPLSDPGDPGLEEARKAIVEAVAASCGAPIAEALEVQARHSGGFMIGDACRRGAIGAAARKVRVD